MGHQTIYKDIGVGDESTWGASIASNATRLHVKTVTLNKTVEKEIVDDTTTSIKGRERSVRLKNTVTGDITGYATPRTMHYMLELAMGQAASTSALGNSANIQTYNQNTSGTMASKSINVDRNNSQETFNGVRASAIDISFSDNKVEFTLNAEAKTQSNVGTSMQDLIGETIKSATFADTVVTIHQGSTYGSQITTLNVESGNVKYGNGLESQFLSGSRDASRSDPKIPTVTGKFKIFHEGTSFVALQHGCSEAYIRFDITYPSCAGLIAGETPYTMRVDVPRVDLISNVRDYNAGEYSMEEVEFHGKLNTGTSSLIDIIQTVGKTL